MQTIKSLDVHQCRISAFQELIPRLFWSSRVVGGAVETVAERERGHVALPARFGRLGALWRVGRRQKMDDGIEFSDEEG